MQEAGNFILFNSLFKRMFKSSPRIFLLLRIMDPRTLISKNVCLKKILEYYCYKRQGELVKGASNALFSPPSDHGHNIGTTPRDS